jgi:hypothetical protein
MNCTGSRKPRRSSPPVRTAPLLIQLGASTVPAIDNFLLPANGLFIWPWPLMRIDLFVGGEIRILLHTPSTRVVWRQSRRHCTCILQASQQNSRPRVMV